LTDRESIMKKTKIQTVAVHGDHSEPIHGSVVTPIFQSSTYTYRGDLEGETVRYIRYSNTPTHDVLHRKLALLEEGEAALATSSGMAAITSALLSVLEAGDHLLVQDTLYGGTAAFVDRDLPRLGIAADKFDARRPEQLAERVRPTTRAILTEALSNPLVQVPDHDAIVAFAKERELVTLIDSTFATPVNYRPLTHGYDLVLHSCTKYMNGHDDVVAGAAIGSRERVKTVADRLKHYGGSLDPHACFLLDRGLKTLALRVGYQNASATRLASFLEQHPAVATVHYPGLESHPDHARGKRWFTGFGGVLSIDLAGGAAAAGRLMGAFRLAFAAPSLGGVETLASRPMLTSHAALDPDERRRLGISDGLVRISVGIEDTDDLIADFEQALQAVEAAVPVAV
jgi:cystathionine beta-lyase/cystathionine gamma-synthase